MEERMTATLENHCGVIEQRIEAMAQQAEARFISLEMGHSEVDTWRPEVERRLENLFLESKRATKFMERETIAADQTKPVSSLLPGRRPNIHLPGNNPPMGHLATALNHVTRRVGLGMVMLKPMSRSRVRTTIHLILIHLIILFVTLN